VGERGRKEWGAGKSNNIVRWEGRVGPVVGGTVVVRKGLGGRGKRRVLETRA